MGNWVFERLERAYAYIDGEGTAISNDIEG